MYILTSLGFLYSMKDLLVISQQDEQIGNDMYRSIVGYNRPPSLIDDEPDIVFERFLVSGETEKSISAVFEWLVDCIDDQGTGVIRLGEVAKDIQKGTIVTYNHEDRSLLIEHPIPF